MSARIDRIRTALEQMHGVRATHAGSSPVREVFQGRPVWEGIVEAFDVTGHPRAKRAYGWEIPGVSPDYVAVLELPPVTSPETAVRAYVLAVRKPD